MFLAFLILLMLDGAVGVLVWLGWRRVAAHLRKKPEVAALLAQHVLTPLLFGEVEKEAGKQDEKPEPKKVKATLV
jgi:hypothetical protein